MMATDTLVIRFRSDAFQAALGNLPNSKTELLKLPKEVVEEVVGLIEAPHELFTLEGDVASTAVTGELIVRLDPSDRLLRLMAALGARNVD